MSRPFSSSDSRSKLWNRCITPSAAITAVCAVCDLAQAQWTVTDLHPAGAIASRALAVRNGQQVGFAQLPGGVNHASVWTGTAASWVDLHPPGTSMSYAYAVDGSTQVGQASSADTHALMWSGTAASQTDLHPAGATVSSAHAARGGVQGGYARVNNVYRACIWGGTPGSYVDLHPATAGSLTSGVYAMYGALQAGVAAGEAGMWTGSAASWVSLKPPLTSDSVVWGMDAAHQVGQAYFVISSQYHAVLWSGSAASFVDLNPAGSTHSAAYGVGGDMQVGYATINFKVVASLWNGSAGTWENLSAALPGTWSVSEARGIWSDGSAVYIVGWGTDAATQQNRALLWTRSLCTVPTVTSNPASVQACATGGETFAAAGSGSAPLSYQWQREVSPNSNTFADLADGPSSSWDGNTPGFGAVISGATTDTLTVAADLANGNRLSDAHAIRYRCVISNACGSTPSGAAQLTVCVADYNCDGFVDGIDSDEFNNDFENPDPGQQMNADINGDGFVDGIDYDLFSNAFEAGC